MLDHNVSQDMVREIVPQILRSLKMHSEVFRNVRLNIVHWESDDVICNQVTPMAVAGLTSYYENYKCQSECKDFMKLVQHLKLFQARSKLIILVTDGVNEEGSLERIKAAMQPFLDKKLMQVVVGEEIKIKYR